MSGCVCISVFLLFLWSSTPVVGVSVLNAQPPVKSSFVSDLDEYGKMIRYCWTDAANRSIDSFEDGWLDNHGWLSPLAWGNEYMCDIFYFDLRSNGLTSDSLGMKQLFVGSDGYNSGKAIFYPGRSRYNQGIVIDLSNNPLGPTVPSVFRTGNAECGGGLILRNTSIKSIPANAFNGISVSGTLDLRDNDLRAGLAPAAFSSFGTPFWDYSRNRSVDILLQNTNLRSSSLSTGLFTSSVKVWSDTLVSLFLNNMPIQPGLAATRTTQQYLATKPNIFDSLPTGLFSDWNGQAALHFEKIYIGDFVSAAGPIFKGVTWFVDSPFISSGIIVNIDLASAVAAQAIGVSDYCPMEMLMNALIESESDFDVILNVPLVGYNASSLNVRGSNLPLPSTNARAGRCIIPDCTSDSADCHLARFTRITVPTEPAFLQTDFTSLLAGGGFDERRRVMQQTLAWTEPAYGLYNPSLNRSDWLSTDLLCPLRLSEFVLPIVPPSFTKALAPAGFLTCLDTEYLNSLQWWPSRWSAGMFDGLVDHSPNGFAFYLNFFTLYDEPIKTKTPFYASLWNNTYSWEMASNTPPLNVFAPLAAQPTIRPACGYADAPLIIHSCDLNTTRQVAGFFCPYEKAIDGSCLPCPAPSQKVIFETNPYNVTFTHDRLPYCATVVNCEQGSSSLGGICMPCAKGTYQDTAGQTNCKPCPANTFRPITGATQLSQCLACSTGMTSTSGSSECTCTMGPNCGSTAISSTATCSSTGGSSTTTDSSTAGGSSGNSSSGISDPNQSSSSSSTSSGDQIIGAASSIQLSLSALALVLAAIGSTCSTWSGW